MKHEENWRELMYAVVIRACADYKKALKRLHRNPKDKKAQYTKMECERFFNDELYKELFELPPKQLIKQIKEVVETDIYYESLPAISPKLLRQARERAGISQEEMSERMGYSSTASYYGFEAGRFRVPANRTKALLEILGVEHSELVGEDKPVLANIER